MARNNSLEIYASYSCLEQAINFVDECFVRSKNSASTRREYLVAFEEVLGKIIEHLDDETKVISLNFNKDVSSNCAIHIGFKGHLFELDLDEDDIRDKIIANYEDKIHLRYNKGYNTVTINVGISYSNNFMLSVIAVIAGIAVGGFFQLIWPHAQRMEIADSVGFVLDDYMAIISLIAPFVAFCCITVTICDAYRDIARIPGMKRIYTSYVGTTIITLITSLLIAGALCAPLGGEVYTEWATDTHTNLTSYMKELLEHWKPETFFSPLINDNVLQLIALSIITGIAVGILSRSSEFTPRLIETVKGLFCKILGMIYTISPLIIFVGTVYTINYFEGGVFEFLYVMAYMFLAVLIALAVVLVGYALILKAYGLPVRETFKQIWPIAFEVGKIGSTIDATPYTIRNTKKVFGLSDRLLNISIPAGANCNMDGNSATIITFLALCAYVYGISLSVTDCILMLLIVFLVSYGAPSQPGTMLITVSIVGPLIGVSDIYPILLLEVLLSKVLAAFNVTGDIISTLTTAKKIKI
ncbi:MAG: dicarboxylate/amino acid:cation symporter [Clostridia bacterium]|nr:dicarboxylate/amino acid:cation symporter [Clostridia bacterium]